ncbi:MAG: hypothetical protein HY235_30035 [Acidobacteria bacterium]|nr:hypothetical protein [Acidobacteriota bacterium]
MLSRRGASHRLLRLVGDPRWRMNLSVPLALEYEQTLKRVCAGGPIGETEIESRSDFIVTFNRGDFIPAGQFGIRVVTPANSLPY